jgi:hypothetical protein
MASDWLDSNRQDQLDMATVWLIIFNEPSAASKTVKKHTAWNIPDAEVKEFSRLVADAKTILDTAKNEETRTKVVDRQVTTAFDALVAKMRSLKKRYFHVPPLTDADLIALKLKVPEKNPGPLGDPTAMITFVFSLTGAYNQIRGWITAVSGDLNARNNRGTFHIKFGVFDIDAPAPTDPSRLTEYRITKRKKEVYKLPYNSSGKMAYFCGRIENGDRKGEWGPIVGVKIP